MPPSRAVGIDLGTTRAAVARIDEAGRSTMFRDPQGDLLIPNVVFFEDDELVFGRAAKQAAVTEPGRAGEQVKRDLGQAAYSRAIGGELLPPEVVEGCMLAYLGANLSAVGPRPAVVLSVPACFNLAQRKALLDAGQIAGVDVLGTINDPLAAALAFAENQGYLNRDADKPGVRVLVFDLGGGTLDAAIIEIKPGRLRTMAVAGDVHLGGRDWDLLLSEHLAGEFTKQFGDDPRYDMVSVRRLLESAEEARLALTARQQARVHLGRASNVVDITITRQTFEEISLDLVARAKSVAETVLARSGLAWRDLAHLLLVGGATRMPMVARALESLTRLKPAPNIHPDEAVARGAALYAECLLAARDRRAAQATLEIADLTAHNLGVEWIDPASGRAENVVIIPRGTELPCGTISNLTTTIDGQTSISVQLVEGEGRSADDCARAGQVVFHDLPLGLPKGWPVEAHYQYSSAGRLQAKAHLERLGQSITVPARRECGMSEQQVAQWRKLLSGRVGLTAILEQLARLRQQQVEPAPPAPQGVDTVASVVSAISPAAGPQNVPAHTGEVEEFDLGSLDGLTARTPRKRTLTPRKIAIMLTGYLVSAALGLAIGYYILMRIDPRYNWFHLRLPGLSSQAPGEESGSATGSD